MMMKICFLVLTHKPLPQLFYFASKHPQYNFYIHVDLKSRVGNITQSGLDNVHFIEKRVNVNWAGFSMVQATLNLIEYALNDDSRNEFFHLISGDDVVLADKLFWLDESIYMESFFSSKHNYRVRFNAWHSDNKYTRHFIGKICTQLLKAIDKIIPTRKKYKFGSQWFSIRRHHLKVLYDSISVEDMMFFRKKLCPDEHFFQYLVEKNNLQKHLNVNGNKRFIVFEKSHQRGSSPIFLDINYLDQARKNNFWMARKVEQETMAKFYKKSLYFYKI